MNKKLLTVAVGAAIGSVPMLVQADVKVGGHAQVEIAREKAEASVLGLPLGEVSATTFEDNRRGRFFIKADEDIKHGLKGLAYFEFQLDTSGEAVMEATSNNQGVSSNLREKYVGLQGNFGTLQLGTLKSPYKYLAGVSWDKFVTTNLEARGAGGMTGGTFGHNNFMDNAIGYISPDIGGIGLKLWGVYVVDDAPSAQGGSTKNVPGSVGETFSTTDDGDYSAGLEWKGSPGGVGLDLIGAVAHNADNTATPPLGVVNDYDVWKIGAKVTVAKNYTLCGQYEKAKNDSGSIDQKVYFLCANAKVGNFLLVGHYGKSKFNGTGESFSFRAFPNVPDTDAFTINPTIGGSLSAGSDATYYVLGAWYNFSKTFGVFGGYRKTNIQDSLAFYDADATAITFGMRKTF